MSELRFMMARGSFPDLRVEQEYLAGKATTVEMAPLQTAKQVASASEDADGLIVTTEPLPRELIEQIRPRVRIIGRAGIGLDAIDLEAARQHGIAVFHTPDYATEEVATHTLAMMLAVNRKIVEGDSLARRDWMAWDTLAPVKPLSEQVVGMVGLGRIGRAVVERLVPFAPKILVFDPYADALPAYVTAVAGLDELLELADMISLHAPLTPETEGMIGERELGILRSGATIINVARGGLIDEEALAAALTAGRLRAALDVLRTEPPSTDAPILSAPSVLLSPHFAWYSDASDRRVRTETLQGMLDYLHERPLTTGRLVVDPRA